MEKIIDARADQVRVGDKILGRRLHHLTVEKAIRTSSYVTFIGVNGWGDPMRMRYAHRDHVGIFREERK